MKGINSVDYKNCKAPYNIYIIVIILLSHYNSKTATYKPISIITGFRR
jgi:hypothetical protein